MNMKIQTNHNDIISTGCAIVPYNEYLQFDIEGMSFRLLFEKNTDNPAAYIRHGLVEENGNHYMALHAYNFNGSLLSTIKNSLDLARIEGRPLSLRLSVTSINKREIDENGTNITAEDMLVYYTWYLQKAD